MIKKKIYIYIWEQRSGIRNGQARRFNRKSQLGSRFFIWRAGDWLRDSLGLIVLHHLPELQNLPGMWQFPTGSLTSRCVQECVRVCVSYLNMSVSLYLWSHHFFFSPGIKTKAPVYRELTCIYAHSESDCDQMSTCAVLSDVSLFLLGSICDVAVVIVADCFAIDTTAWQMS